MTRVRLIGWRMQGVLLTLALTAVLLRGAIPAGWMVAPSAGFPMVICTTAGADISLVDWADEDGRAKAPGSHDDAPCAFAATAGAPAQPTVEPFAASAALLAAAAVAEPADLIPGRGLPAPPPPATGPPRLV